MKIIELLNNITNSQSIIVFLISMAPIGELRFSIPYGLIMTDLNWFTVYWLSVVGNILVGIIIIYILPYIIGFITRFKYINIAYSYILKRTYKNSVIIQKRKYYGLMFFVSLPLPFTGVWTGALASNLFGLSKHKSIAAISFGVLLSSLVVTSLVYFGFITFSYL